MSRQTQTLSALLVQHTPLHLNSQVSQFWIEHTTLLERGLEDLLSNPPIEHIADKDIPFLEVPVTVARHESLCNMLEGLTENSRWVELEDPDDTQGGTFTLVMFGVRSPTFKATLEQLKKIRARKGWGPVTVKQQAALLLAYGEKRLFHEIASEIPTDRAATGIVNIDMEVQTEGGVWFPELRMCDSSSANVLQERDNVAKKESKPDVFTTTRLLFLGVKRES